MKVGDLVMWRQEIWKQDPKTRKRLGVKPCKVFEDIGIILSKKRVYISGLDCSQASHDSFSIMFTGNNVTHGVWDKELKVINEIG